MRLAAIYIDKHEFLFDEAQTINLGGEYLYSFEKIEENNEEIIEVKRKKNEQFIPDFFNIVEGGAKLTLVTGVAGQNGAGKTSLMNLIRNQSDIYRYAKENNSILIFEKEDLGYPLIREENFFKVKLVLKETDEFYTNFNNKYLVTKVENPNNVEIDAIRQLERKTTIFKKISSETIYYSPHFSYTDSLYTDYDISFDESIEDDLMNYLVKEAIGDNNFIIKELIFKNSLRQIEFMSSDLVEKQEIFQDLLHLPEHGKSKLIFQGCKVDKDNGDVKVFETSYGKKIENIIKKIKSELKEFYKNRKLYSNIEYSKYVLKQKVIEQIINSLTFQIEIENYQYKDKGLYFDTKLFDEKIKEIDNNKSITIKSLEYLYVFLDLFEINEDEKREKVFDIKIIRNLIQTIYKAIDETEENDHIKYDVFFCSEKDTIEILKAQREFLKVLHYHEYRFSKNQGYVKGDRIDGFINYEPLKNLSSGENALLNLFSRLYNIINERIIGKQDKCKHYILILDEGDLGFHPTWKKKYLNALCKTLPHIMGLIPEEISFQIIFTTHDPLTLSDLPNSNVVYIERKDYNHKSKVLNNEDKNRPTRTFGANITDLLADSFFLEGSLIGDFATEKIKETIEWLNEKDDKKDEREKYKTIIEMIDEPILQRKLGEMYDEKVNDADLKNEIIDKQIRYLKTLKN